MTYNHLTMKIEVGRWWYLYIDIVVGFHNSGCSVVRAKDCGIVALVMGHLRVIISEEYMAIVALLGCQIATRGTVT